MNFYPDQQLIEMIIKCSPLTQTIWDVGATVSSLHSTCSPTDSSLSLTFPLSPYYHSHHHCFCESLSLFAHSYFFGPLCILSPFLPHCYFSPLLPPLPYHNLLTLYIFIPTSRYLIPSSQHYLQFWFRVSISNLHSLIKPWPIDLFTLLSQVHISTTL